MKAALESPPATLSLSRLRALTAVGEEGSYAAAARRLGISHSAVSQQVHWIEAAYSLRLFDRRNGVLHPTPVCRQLCDVGTRMQEAERDAALILGRRDSTGKSRLRVGLGNSMPGLAIVAILIARHQEVSVQVESGSHEAILAAVLRREVDVAVLPDVPADHRFRRTPILSHEVVAITSADHAAPADGSFTLDQLARAPLIYRSRGSSTQRVVDRAFRQAGLSPVPRLVADTRDAVYEAVALGIGVGFMWRHGTFRADAVRRIPVPDMGPPVEEIAFALVDELNPLIDLFFSLARLRETAR